VTIVVTALCRVRVVPTVIEGTGWTVALFAIMLRSVKVLGAVAAAPASTKGIKELAILPNGENMPPITLPTIVLLGLPAVLPAMTVALTLLVSSGMLRERIGSSWWMNCLVSSGSWRTCTLWCRPYDT
jgi:hypothetical protein